VTIVVDYYSDFLLPDDSAAFMRCLKASGIDAIARYLTASMGDARQLTVREVADAHAAGLGVIFVFEMNPTYPGYFTFAQGVSDCQNAHARLIDLGAPAPSVVYFTVDANIAPALTTPYFDGIESVVGDAVIAGGYGYERFVEYARANFSNVGKRLWQTYGTARGPLDLWQHEQLAMCGVTVDINDATVSGWRKDMDPEDEKALAEAGLDPNTIETIKRAIDEHVHLPGPITPSATSRPLIPPVSGALYAGSSVDLSQIVWLYPDGTRHTWVEGKDTTQELATT